MESAFIEAGDIRVHYRHAGSGPPVVLLHGFPETSWEWRHVGPLLAERFTVLAPDTRGHGGTDKPAHGYSRRALAADVVAFLDALGLDEAAVVGHDWGGIIACKLALDWPERVSRLALLDTICTGWPVFVDYYYWFMAPGLAERFFERYSRQFIETLLTGRSDPPLPGAPESPWYIPPEFLAPTVWATAQDIDEYADALADPAARAADLAYYRELQFVRVISDPSAPHGERFEPVSHEHMATMWHQGEAGREYLDFGPDDRHKRYPGPTLWMFGEYLAHAAGGKTVAGVPTGDPAFDSFPRHFPVLETVPVAAGHFFPEESPDVVASELMRFLTAGVAKEER